MKELVLPFTCRQLRWSVLIIFPIIFIFGLITVNLSIFIIGAGFGLGCWICQIMDWSLNKDFEFNIRCKCDD